MDIPGDINLEAIISAATARVLFSEGARTGAQAAARGFLELAHKINVTPQIEEDHQDILGTPIPGQVDRIDTRSGRRLMGYDLQADSWDLTNLALLYGADKATAFTQAAIAGVAVDNIAFTAAAPSIAGKWYPLLKGGVQILHATAVTAVVGATALVEDTDFEVDLTHGLIRFLTEQAADVTPSVTAGAVTDADPEFMNALEPGKVLIRRGIMRLSFYDQVDENRQVLTHEDFLCTLRATGGEEINGEGQPKISMSVAVCYPHGKLYVRRANAAAQY